MTLGSSFILNSTPLPSSSARSSARRASASTAIERNLSIVNRVPWAPTRSCRKITGPGLPRRTAIAMAANNGASSTSATVTTDMSNSRLTAWL